jgi:hypothetical protein
LLSGCRAADRMMADWVGLSFCRAITVIASLLFAAEDREQVIERGFHPTKVANVAPVDGFGVITKVIVGQLLQTCQFGVDGGSAGEVGIEGGWRGIHRGLRG